MADLTNQLQAAAGASTGVASDADFENTVLLLHGDGTNGAQNNTFIDSSTNNFTITRNGNTTQGTFTPFSKPDGRWGTYFAGGGSRLTITTISLASDFCIEGWFYIEPLADTYALLVGHDGTTGSSNDQFRVVRSSGAVGLIIDGSSTIADSGTAATLNAWHHIVACRSGTDCAVFVDGVRQGTGTSSGTFAATWIGDRNAASYDYMGYISNLRIVNGDSVYNPTSSSLTVPTGPLSDITDTDILTCSLNRFVDASAAATTVTPVGTVRVTPFSPFPITTAYSTSVNGGAGYFDGSGDYLSIADAAGLRFGTGNFTIQAWIYRNAAGAVHSIAAKGGASTGWVFQVHSDNKLRFTQTTTNIDSTGTIPAGAWTHVAVVREGTGTNQTKLYINGVNDGQATVTTNFNQTEQLNIGADRGNSNVMNGYIAGFKYVVGTAETITVPTAPPTGGTALLNFTNAGIFDNTGFNALDIGGNAQIDTSVKKYGTGSMEFDGDVDFLFIPSSHNLEFRSGPYTIEFWIYPNSLSAIASHIVSANASNGLVIYVNNAKITLDKFGVGDVVAYNTPLSTSVWTHVAVVREGTGSNQTKIYINGTAQATGTDNNSWTVTTNFAIGGNPLNSQQVLNGYIDDLRITKGIARYTTTFTPPTAALPDLGA